MLDAHIIKRRRTFVVDVTLHVAAGAAMALFGASGSGKSTVLSCIAGLEEPDGGYVRLNDLQLFAPSLPLYQRPVGYMSQNADLFPHLTVAQNVQFSINGAASDRRWVAELRDRLQLSDVWTASAARVSGGQARRVALARMLARRPALVLLDEPFAGLDQHTVRGLIEDLLDWQTRIDFGMIVVDHHVPVLERLCPRAVVLDEGCVVQTGTWTELRQAPATSLLEQLLEPL